MATVHGVAKSQTRLSDFAFRGTRGKGLPMQEIREMRVPSLGWEDLLEKVTATHSSILARIIPWIEEHRK